MTISKIFIGGQDRAGTTLLATFMASFSNDAKVLYETPFKFKYLKSSLIMDKYFTEEKNKEKYYQEFGFTNFPSQADVLNLFSGNVVDHTPKNMWFYKDLKRRFGSSCIFLLIWREKSSLYQAHKRVSWGIKSPLKFTIWYYITFYKIKSIQNYKNVIVLNYDQLLSGKTNYINSLLKYKKNGVRVNGRKPIPLASYTKKQHSLVNNDIVVTKKNDVALNLTERIVFRLDFLIRPLLYLLIRFI